MTRIKFKLYEDYIQCPCMIDASATDIVDVINQYPGSDFWIKANNPIIDNDDILYMSRINGKWWINEHLNIPKTLLNLVK